MTDSDGAVHTEDHGSEDRPAPDAKQAKKKRPLWVELPILVGVALVLTVLIQSFVARVFLIPSESMEQTLHGCAGCTGDRVLVDKVVFDFRDPHSGDVVVFERPQTWGGSAGSGNVVTGWLQDFGSLFGVSSPDEQDIVKRVIAVGGQTVECCDAQNRVLVDGKPLDEPYLHFSVPGGKQEPFDKITVPAGRLFVMGDNRNNSSDSRYQGGGGQNGMVPVDDVIGKARTIILPPSRWQGVGDHDPQSGAAQALSAPAWQAGIPAGVGFAAAWPVLLVGRRIRRSLGAARGTRSGPPAPGPR